MKALNEGEILLVNQRQARLFDQLYTMLPRSPTRELENLHLLQRSLVVAHKR